MASNTVKRRFYNCGDAKGFTKRVYYETLLNVLKSIENPMMDDDKTMDLLIAATEYELEGLDNKNTSSASTGEKKDPLQSEYAISLANAIVPLVTSEPKTASELVEEAARNGLLSSTGKNYSVPWTTRVLKATAGIATCKKVVEKKDSKGLVSQKEVTAFIRG